MSDNYDKIRPEVMERIRTLPGLQPILTAVDMAWAKAGADTELARRAVFVLMAYGLGELDAWKEVTKQLPGFPEEP